MAGEHRTQEKEAWIPTQRHEASPANEATMVLPVYTPPAATPEPAAPKPAAPPVRVKDTLPSDERNMLIFVSALLAAGTLAIVAMASIGR
jgi:hypothetical protein